MNLVKFGRCLNCRSERHDSEEGPAEDPLDFYLAGMQELQQRYQHPDVPRAFGISRLTMDEARQLLQEADADLQVLLHEDSNGGP